VVKLTLERCAIVCGWRRAGDVLATCWRRAGDVRLVTAGDVRLATATATILATATCPTAGNSDMHGHLHPPTARRSPKLATVF
jgi:hypothetical protein